MRHDSTEPIWLPVTGPTGWHTTAAGVQVSIDNAVTWVNATIAPLTAVAITLANGTAGTRCYISVPATSLALVAGTRIQMLARLTNGSDTPVMVAAGKFNIT